MTVGSRTEDYRSSINTTAGVRLAGRLATKTWNGADQVPKRSRVRRKPTYKVVKTRMQVWRNGRQIWYTHRSKVRVYTGAEPPPKRIRTEEHPYTVSGRDEVRVLYQLQAPLYLYGGVIQTDVTGYSGSGGYSGIVGPQWDSNDDLKVLGSLRNVIAGSDFNLGIAVAEGPEALRLIRDSATRIASALHAFKRGRIDNAARILVAGTDRQKLFRKTKVGKSSADNWLQLQYGWLPLLNDAKQGAEFLAHHLNHPRQTSVRASHTRRSPQSNATNTPYGKWLEAVNYQRKSIKAILREKDVAALAGLQDPLSVAWELVPYSFVADWFIPIGSWLSARGLAHSISGTFVTSTKKEFGVRNLATVYNDINTWHIINGPYGVAKNMYYELTRTVSTSLSVPLPSFKPLSKVASWQHTANAVALLVNPANKARERL